MTSYANDNRLDKRIVKERSVNYRLELVAVPVSDVDVAKSFYVDKVGFVLDVDQTVNDELRFVQLTPPGSACSIAIGTAVVESAPGSAQGLQLVVDDADQAHADLASRGVQVSDVQQFPWGRFVFFRDPDGNGWAVQEIPPRT
jgi:catechol 2,3-dioxygenase-like lactoylglutathione lyase family enzyme